MTVNAPKSFIDMCHLLTPELKKRYAQNVPVTLIDNYRGDELIYGYFDQIQGIVLYLNRIYNPNRRYDTNKIKFIIVFLHEAIHSMRGFKTNQSDKEKKKIQQMNSCIDFELLYEMDCQVATYQLITSNFKELCEQPFSLDERRLRKALMREKCEILLKFDDILCLRRSKAYTGNLLSKELLVPWARLSGILFDLNNMPDILYNSTMVSTGVFGNHNQYLGSVSPDNIQINSLPVTNINGSRGKRNEE